jgi:hypothetical protein
MLYARDRKAERTEAQSELQDWLAAVVVLGVMFAGAVGALGLAYLFLTGR